VKKIRNIIASLFNAVWTSSFTWEFMPSTGCVPVKVTDAIQKSGLDYHIHGEVARGI